MAAFAIICIVASFACFTHGAVLTVVESEVPEIRERRQLQLALIPLAAGGAAMMAAPAAAAALAPAAAAALAPAAAGAAGAAAAHGAALGAGAAAAHGAALGAGAAAAHGAASGAGPAAALAAMQHGAGAGAIGAELAKMNPAAAAAAMQRFPGVASELGRGGHMPSQMEMMHAMEMLEGRGSGAAHGVKFENNQLGFGGGHSGGAGGHIGGHGGGHGGKLSSNELGGAGGHGGAHSGGGPGAAGHDHHSGGGGDHKGSSGAKENGVDKSSKGHDGGNEPETKRRDHASSDHATNDKKVDHGDHSKNSDHRQEKGDHDGKNNGGKEKGDHERKEAQHQGSQEIPIHKSRSSEIMQLHRKDNGHGGRVRERGEFLEDAVPVYGNGWQPSGYWQRPICVRWTIYCARRLCYYHGGSVTDACSHEDNRCVNHVVMTRSTCTCYDGQVYHFHAENDCSSLVHDQMYAHCHVRGSRHGR